MGWLMLLVFWAELSIMVVPRFGLLPTKKNLASLDPTIWPLDSDVCTAQLCHLIGKTHSDRLKEWNKEGSRVVSSPRSRRGLMLAS